MMRIYKRKIKAIAVLIVCGCFVCAAIVWFYTYKRDSVTLYKHKPIPLAQTIPIDPFKSYRVVEVVDGDTVKVLIDGHTITIRLLGVNTPEVVDPRKGVECYGPEASARTKSLLVHAEVLVSLNQDYDRTDKYGRLLAYLWIASSSRIFVNELLIKEGFAREYTFDRRKPYQYRSLFKEDESVARKEKRGLWKACNATTG